MTVCSRERRESTTRLSGDAQKGHFTRRYLSRRHLRVKQEASRVPAKSPEPLYFPPMRLDPVHEKGSYDGGPFLPADSRLSSRWIFSTLR